MQIAAVRLTEGVNEAICTRWLSCLPGKRQEEILRRQRPKDRERSLSGEILARAMLARELRCPLRDVPICRETHGKPVLKDCTNLFLISAIPGIMRYAQFRNSRWESILNESGRTSRTLRAGFAVMRSKNCWNSVKTLPACFTGCGRSRKVM